VNALVRAAYRLAARGLRIWARLAHPTLHGAAVVVRSGDHVLTVRTSYQSWLTVPGGRVGRRERPLAAARRELGEEAGLEVAEDGLLALGELVCDHSNVEDHVSFFEWRPAGPRPEARIDRREIIEAAWLTEDEILEHKLWPPLRMLLEREREPTGERDAGAEPTPDA
jgi:ADP-ribose pyrophosphatase YjhB (NUDIX family)